ncbi:MAG: VCBS repeat-containing protein [Acidobacteriota bacterium]
MKRTRLLPGLLAVGIALGCSSSSSSSRTRGAAPTPTPAASNLARINPYVIEETDTYTIQRYPKAEYIRIDDRHIKHPILGVKIEFFREDENYYYVSVPKFLAEEDALRRATQAPEKPRVRQTEDSGPPGPPLTDFTDLLPPRKPSRIRLEKASSGLPAEGLWRSSFEVADVNGDGIPDIVSPPSRIGGNPVIHIFIGDGKGSFTRWPLKFTEAGKAEADPGVDYGGVAVADIDGDGHADVAAASHGGGLVTFFGDGKGGFTVVRGGLPGREFSAQAIVLLDVTRDGHPDIVAARDIVESENVQEVDRQQVRVYVYRDPRAWQFRQDGIVGGFYSNSLNAWDYDGDGLKDVLTGSHYNGALTLLWKNAGDGSFTPVSFPAIEIYAFHFATAPGTFGRDRAPAFADSYYMSTNEPQNAKAGGITLYTLRKSVWERRRIWRKANGKSLQYGLAMGDLDGDGLDDIIFPDSEERRLRIFFQQADGSFAEANEKDEPALDSPGQCVRLADIDRDGRLDLVLSKTVSSLRPDDVGGWDVYLNKK